jgi:hypothetical protein
MIYKFSDDRILGVLLAFFVRDNNALEARRVSLRKGRMNQFQVLLHCVSWLA